MTISNDFSYNVDKLVSYTCWVIISASLAVAFDFPLLNKIILGIVTLIELLSVIIKHFAMRGKKIIGLLETILKIAGKKIEAYLSDINIEDDEASKTLSL